jgi:hypothetical protein
MTDPHAGDPAALQAEAARLRSVAEAITQHSRGVDQRLAALDFRGPAADRIRTASSERTVRATRVATQLQDLADQLASRAHAG